MRARFYLLFAAALAVTGCVRQIGQSVDQYPIANSPEGVAATVLFRTEGSIAGELLEVRDTALVLRRGTEVLLVPNAAVATVRLDGAGFGTRSMTPDQFRQRQLHLLSRYPSGITPAVMAALLSASGKPEPTTVSR